MKAPKIRLNPQQALSLLIYSLLIGIACLLFSACTSTGDPVTEVNSPGASALGNEQLQREVEQVKKEVKKEITKIDPEVQEIVQGARRIGAGEYLMRFPQSRTAPGNYVVGDNDILTIKVYNEPDLTQENVQVNNNGNISFPFIESVKVAGRTPDEIEKEISSRLVSQGYFINPHVSVKINEYRSNKVLVLGAVNQPGSYYLEDSIRVLDILSRAGGVDFEQGGTVVTLIREEHVNGHNQKVAVQIDLRDLFSGQHPETNLVLRDQDIIFVPESAKIYVIGQVQTPGEYILGNKKLSLIEAIGQAGGFTRIAARKRVRIVRQTESGEKTLVVNVQRIMEEGWNGDEIELQTGDLVVVPERFF